jgi:hypothetical protein
MGSDETVVVVMIEISVSTTEPANLPQLRITILSWEPASRH